MSFRGPLFCHSDCLCPDIQITSISFRLFVPTFRLYLSCHSYCLHCCHSHSLSQHSYSLYLLVQMISILSYRVYPSQGPVKCLRSAFNPKVATKKKTKLESCSVNLTRSNPKILRKHCLIMLARRIV